MNTTLSIRSVSLFVLFLSSVCYGYVWNQPSLRLTTTKILHPTQRHLPQPSSLSPSSPFSFALGSSIESIKTVRERTGAGISKCKEALAANEGDIEKSIKWLIQKEFASMDKKMSRATKDGLIGVYVHRGSKTASMVEVNCETDFVSRRPEFHKLANNLALQVTASDGLRYIYEKDIPESDILQQMEHEILHYNREQNTTYNTVGEAPEDVKQILQTKAKKTLKQFVLMEQKFFENNDQTVDEYIRSNILSFGENIFVKRFTLFKVGE